MKELSIKEKAKRYDEAIKKAKGVIEQNPLMEYLKKGIEYIFPELKESEDERIRKEILDYIINGSESCYDVQQYGRERFEKWIAWLEKQKGCEYIKKDWLEHIKQSWYKEGFIDGKYSGETSKEWTINDDATLKELIDFLENGTTKLQHDLTRYANWLKIQFTPTEKHSEQKPIYSEEQHEKESLSDIENRIINFAMQFHDNRMKPEAEWEDEVKMLRDNIKIDPWSEEDEEIVEALNDYVKNLDILFSEIKIGDKDILSKEFRKKIQHWLKSLKDRVQPQPKQEWSEEDENNLNSCISKLEIDMQHWEGHGKTMVDGDRKLISWLKSIRPQSQWKPSDEQMKALDSTLQYSQVSHNSYEHLNSLFNDLKKLMKE